MTLAPASVELSPTSLPFPLEEHLDHRSIHKQRLFLFSIDAELKTPRLKPVSLYSVCPVFALFSTEHRSTECGKKRNKEIYKAIVISLTCLVINQLKLPFTDL